MVESRHCLDVVIENLGPGGQHECEGVPVALEIGDEDLDGGIGAEGVDGLDRAREDVGSTVGQLIAIDGGDDGVPEVKPGNGFGNAIGLAVVQPLRPPRLYGAEAATARAHIAKDHERGSATLPALADIRAMGTLAHSIQVKARHQPLQL